MTAFWTSLSVRERNLIRIALAIVSLFVALQLVLVPLMGWRADALVRKKRAESLFALVSEASARGAAPLSGAAASDEPVRNLLSRTAAEAGVALSFVNARPDGVVDAAVATSDPAAVITWMARLEREFGVVATTADIARDQAAPASVRGQFTFARPAAGP